MSEEFAGKEFSDQRLRASREERAAQMAEQYEPKEGDSPLELDTKRAAVENVIQNLDRLIQEAETGMDRTEKELMDECRRCSMALGLGRNIPDNFSAEVALQAVRASAQGIIRRIEQAYE